MSYLNSIERPWLGSSIEYFFSGHLLDFINWCIGILASKFLDDVDILHSMFLEFVHFILRIWNERCSNCSDSWPSMFNVVGSHGSHFHVFFTSFSGYNDSSLVCSILLREVLVYEEPFVSNVSSSHSHWEEGKGQDGFKDGDFSIGRPSKDSVKPDVGKDRPNHCDKENSQMLDLFDLRSRNHPNTDGNDDKEIEGSRPDNSSWTEISCIEVLGINFNDGQQNFRSGRSKSHQSKIRDGFVPDSDWYYLSLSIRFRDCDLLFLRSNHFNRSHEPVGDDGHSNEKIDEGQEVEGSSCKDIPSRQIREGLPCRNHESIDTFEMPSYVTWAFVRWSRVPWSVRLESWDTRNRDHQEDGQARQRLLVVVHTDCFWLAFYSMTVFGTWLERFKHDVGLLFVVVCVVGIINDALSQQVARIE